MEVKHLEGRFKIPEIDPNQQLEVLGLILSPQRTIWASELRFAGHAGLCCSIGDKNAEKTNKQPSTVHAWNIVMLD